MPRKGLTQEAKLDVVKRKDRGERNKDIAKHYGVNESSIRTILKKREAILKTAMAYGAGPGADRRVRVVDSAVILMERYLFNYCHRKAREGVPIGSVHVRRHARHLYGVACTKLRQEPGSFKASTGWFSLFKKRWELRRARVTGERASADTDAADNYPAVLRHIIEEGEYLPHQVYNIDETGLEYKRMPRSTYITKQEKQARGRKPDHHKQTILLSCNLAGHKLKPLFVSKVMKPRCFSHLRTMRQSGVYWAKTANGWMTNLVMREWFNDFIKDTRLECQAQGVPFKILLVLDNASSHHGFLEELHPRVRVEYLPPRTTSLIQPLDQEIIANFKFAYEELLYDDLRRATDSGIEEVMMLEEALDADAEAEDSDIDEPPSPASPPPGPSSASPTPGPSSASPTPGPSSASPTSAPARDPCLTVTAYWRKYNMKNVVENVLKAWDKVSPATINHAWRKLVPHLTTPQQGQARCPTEARDAALRACRAVPGCADVTEEEIGEVIMDDTTPEEAQARVDAMDQEVGAAYVPPQPQEEPEEREISLRQINNILAASEHLFEALDEHETEELRKITMITNLRQMLKTYEELRRDRINKSRQCTIEQFFRQRQQQQEESDDDDVASVVSAYTFEGFNEAVEETSESEEEAQVGAGSQ